jgi:tetratricopeptide (TPR) repeat protein
VANPFENIDETESRKDSDSSSLSDDMSATNPSDFIFNANEDGKGDGDAKKAASILDLIETKDVFVSLSGAEDIDEILQGDSLDDILKNPSSDDQGRWRSSKTAEEQERRRRLSAKSKRKVRIVIVSIVIFILVVSVSVYYLIPEKIPENINSIQRATFARLDIPPSLSDEKQLQLFYDMANKLIASGKTKKAQVIFRKLAKTQWRKSQIQVDLGYCREKLGDESGALKYYSKAVELGYRSTLHPLLLVATDQYEQGKYVKVILTLRLISKKFPKDEKLAALLGSAYFKSGNYEKAFEFLKNLFFNAYREYL